MNLSDELLDIIDKRIDNYLKTSKIICRYTAQVIGQDGEHSYKVTLLGYDTVFTFPAREYITAKEGDFVLVESKMSNLSNGVITDIIKGG